MSNCGNVYKKKVIWNDFNNFNILKLSKSMRDIIKIILFKN